MDVARAVFPSSSSTNQTKKLLELATEYMSPLESFRFQFRWHSLQRYRSVRSVTTKARSGLPYLLAVSPFRKGLNRHVRRRRRAETKIVVLTSKIGSNRKQQRNIAAGRIEQYGAGCSKQEGSGTPRHPKPEVKAGAQTTFDGVEIFSSRNSSPFFVFFLLFHLFVSVTACGATTLAFRCCRSCANQKTRLPPGICRNRSHVRRDQVNIFVPRVFFGPL